MAGAHRNARNARFGIAVLAHYFSCSPAHIAGRTVVGRLIGAGHAQREHQPAACIAEALLKPGAYLPGKEIGLYVRVADMQNTELAAVAVFEFQQFIEERL